MNIIGASSSCFYPLETEKAFKKILGEEIGVTEIFFNSPSELEKPFVKKLLQMKNEFSADVVSVHPFMSFSEGYSLFSPYYRRFEDGLEYYKRYFEAAAELGARFVVLHGSRGKKLIPDEEYARRYLLLEEAAEKFGVSVTHENVVDYSGESPEFMLFLKRCLGEKFKMTLDLKQARRAKEDVFGFVDLLRESIVHIHVSDFKGSEDCLPPSCGGEFDFERFFKKMNEIGYGGAYMVELYRQNFKDEKELKKSTEYLKSVFESI